MLAILIPKVYYTYLSIDVFNMRSFIRAAVAKYIAGKEVSCKGNITLPSK
jgi:predicted DNA-binding ribbon-helix-helix protein|tara:strand:+ start:1314 stop:1463 length:150 start_codon:yes stop_codon:yes gene_type:complete